MEMPPDTSSLELELKKYEFTFPILQKLSTFLNASNYLRGKRIGWHCHLTGLTAASARVLLDAGAELIMSECSAGTTDPAAVNFMQQLGARVYQGSESPRKVLEHKPQLLSDTGFVLSTEYLRDIDAGKVYVYGGSEITTSGIQKMQELDKLKFPIININDGELKTLIENYHGVGDGVIDALFRTTGRMWSGRFAAVLGYGRVGAGVANYLRRTGAQVYVIELDPVRKLLAHYDGFALVKLNEALKSCELLVTASGCHSVIRHDHLKQARDGLILMNVGHWAEEIDLADIRKHAKNCKQLSAHLDEYQIADSAAGTTRSVYLIGSGGPANVVMLSGSPEPTLIHLTTEILCMHQFAKMMEQGTKLEAGEIAVPAEVQRQASLLALESLGLD